MVQAPQTGGSFLKSIPYTIGLLFKLKGVLCITLIIIVLSSFSSIIDSVKEKSILPFVKTVGGHILNHDTQLYMEAEKIEKAGGIVINSVDDSVSFGAKFNFYYEIIKALFKVFINLWYLYFFAFVFYKLAVVLFTNNSSAVGSNLAIAVIALIVLQIMTNFIIADKDILIVDGEYKKMTLKEKMTPFKGLYKFITILPLAFNPIYTVVENYNTNIENLENNVITL